MCLVAAGGKECVVIMNEIQNKLVSIIIPVYNGEKYIKRCLSCVLAQDYKYIQLIIINDGSNDKTDYIIKCMLGQLSNKLYDVQYYFKENGGVGSAVNYALKYFNGEFLYLYDVDDILLPNAVNDCVNFLNENKEYSLVQANGYIVTEQEINSVSTTFFDSNYKIVNNDLFAMIIRGQTFNWPGSYMIRSIDWLKANKSRDIFESRNGQNMQMLMPATYKHKSGLIYTPVMKYIVHSQSLSHFQGSDSYDKKIKASKSYQEIYLHVCENILEEKDKEEVFKIINETFLRSRFNLSLKYNKTNDINEYYCEMKKNRLITLNDKINYYNEFNKMLCFILKIFRKIIIWVK